MWLPVVVGVYVPDSSDQGLFSSDITLKSEYVQAQGGNWPYLVVGPENPDPNKEYPVLVFLHGGGNEFGGGESEIRNTSMAQVLINGKQQTVDLAKFNGYVIFPQSQDTSRPHSWKKQSAVSQVCNILDDFQSRYNVKIDQDKISLSGHCDGAIGVQYFAAHFNDQQNKYKLHRAALISGFASNTSINESKVDVIGYYAQNDEKGSLSYMPGLAKKSDKVKSVTCVPGGHATAPEQAYIIDSDKNGKSDYFEWLFS